MSWANIGMTVATTAAASLTSQALAPDAPTTIGQGMQLEGEQGGQGQPGGIDLQAAPEQQDAGNAGAAIAQLLATPDPLAQNIQPRQAPQLIQPIGR